MQDSPHPGAELEFGQVVKRRRKQMDLTQQALADELGYSVDTIKKIEAGKLRPSRQLADMLARVLDVPDQERHTFVQSARIPSIGTNPPSDVLNVQDQASEIASPRSARIQTGPSRTNEPGNANNLPAQLTALVGREKEISSICELLRRPEVRLVTLTGPGGTGKTRLALEAATALLGDFPDGVFFVDLAPITNSSLVVSTIAQALDVQESGDRPLIDILKDYLSDKAMLLVTDNFEQVVGAGADVARLLESCPSVKVLVTSRVHLRVRGEKEYPVPSLALPPEPRASSLPSPDELSQYEAVRLFIERALDVKPDFQVTNDNAPAVAEICVRLDGLPLAIELAAARVAMLPPQGLLSRLSSRLRLLTQGATDLPARQQTLRNTIEWSYDLLDEEEKRLFRRLAVFVGGCTLDAVEAVCNAGGSTETDLQMDVLDGVSSLVEKSLLQQQEGVGGEPRLVMLETIHEYAWEKLNQSGEEEKTRRHHALYYCRLAEEAGLHLKGLRQAEWLDRLEEEHDNLRAALDWSQSADAGPESPSRLEIGLRLAGALFKFWTVRGHFTEGRERLARMLSHPQSLAPAALGARAGALNTAGALAWNQSDMFEARHYYEECLRIWEQLGDKADKLQVNHALTGLGLVAWQQGDFDAALSLHDQALAVAREIGNDERTAVALLNLGDVLVSRGDFERAKELLEESLRLSRAIDDKRTIGMELLMMGIIARTVGIMKRNEGDHRQARALFEESLATYRAIGEKRWSLYNTYELGQVAYAEGDYTQALDLFRASLEGGHTLGDRTLIALNLGGLGLIAEAEGKPERAALMLGASGAIFVAIGSREFPIEHATFERGEESVRAQLGEERWHKVWLEGRSMTVDQAVRCALEDSVGSA